MTFDDFFKRLTGHPRHDWQARLARDSACRDRLIRIPTGLGKTAGVTIAWLWNRVREKNDECAPAPVDMADEADEQEDVNQGIGSAGRQYKTIATHGVEVAAEASR